MHATNRNVPTFKIFFVVTAQNPLFWRNNNVIASF